jgi:long-chain acyl-CoA synthetase
MRSDPILESFAALVRRDARAPLVASTSRSASRGDVDALAASIASALEGIRVPPGSTVLVAAANGAGFLAAILGCRRARVVPALCDRGAPAEERRRIVFALSAVAEVVCESAFPGRIDDVDVASTGVAAAPIEDAGYVKLTSGSTGEPTGVAISPEALASDDEQLARTMGLVAEDRFLAGVPWSHSYGLSSLVLPALRRGSLLVLPEDGGPWAPLAAARELGATVMPTVPIYLRTLAEIAPADAWPPSLATVISAGARLAPEDAGRFREVFGRAVHVFYGATECGGITYDREGGAAERGTVGTPVAAVVVRLEGDAAPREGTVTVSSPAVASRHVPADLPSLRNRVFHSADLAAWTAGGELRLLGRVDLLINVDGKKVQPGEVEAVLRAMPGVREAVVLGVRASAEKEIVRAVIARDPGRLSYEEVAAWCRPRLAPHKVPRSILFVNAIPRTGRGKVDRAALSGLDRPDERG